MARRRQQRRAAGGDEAHTLPARAGRPLSGGPAAVGPLARFHRGGVHGARGACRTCRAAARGIVLQPRRPIARGRIGYLAVHAQHGAPLHACRPRDRRAQRSFRCDARRRPAARVQLLDYRQLANGDHGLQPRPRRRAPGNADSRRHRLCRHPAQLQRPYVRLRLAQFLRCVPGRKRGRSEPGTLFPGRRSGVADGLRGAEAAGLCSRRRTGGCARCLGAPHRETQSCTAGHDLGGQQAPAARLLRAFTGEHAAGSGRHRARFRAEGQVAKRAASRSFSYRGPRGHAVGNRRAL